MKGKTQMRKLKKDVIDLSNKKRKVNITMKHG